MALNKKSFGVLVAFQNLMIKYGFVTSEPANFIEEADAILNPPTMRTPTDELIEQLQKLQETLDSMQPGMKVGIKEAMELGGIVPKSKADTYAVRRYLNESDLLDHTPAHREAWIRRLSNGNAETTKPEVTQLEVD